MRIITTDGGTLSPSGGAGGVSGVNSINVILPFSGDGTLGYNVLWPNAVNALYLVCVSFVVTATTLATGTGTGFIDWTDAGGARVENFHMGTLDMTGQNTIMESLTIQTGPASIPIQAGLTLAGWSAGAATVVLRAAVLRLR